MKSLDPVKIVSVRGTNFEAAKEEGGNATVENFAVSDLKTDFSEFISQELTKSERPELTAAKIVISGGKTNSCGAS